MRTKTAVITGAASGIGFAIAKDLGRQGCKIVLTDANVSKVKEAEQQLSDMGFDVCSAKLDVTCQDDIESIAKLLESMGGYVDFLVNNAGIQFVSRLEEFPVDRWKLIIDILLVGPAMLTRELLPMMRRQNFGRIINIGSVHSLRASLHKSAYVAAKHGLLGLSKSVALEVADQDITINTVCPGYVSTPLVEMQIANQAKEHGISEDEVINKIMLAPMPKKAFIAMDEIIGAVNYLVSGLARNMTGSEIVLDGGWIAK